MSNGPFAFPNEQRNQLPPAATVATIADLRALSPGQAAAANVGGTSSIGDGGGGIYAWNATDTRQDNGTTIIASNASPGIGRWVQIAGSAAVGNLSGNVTGSASDTVLSAIGTVATPAIGPNAGQFYKATTPTQSAWEALQGSDLPGRFRADIVQDFDADPTGSADSMGSIQAALAASNDVKYPSGTFKIAATGSIGASGHTHHFEQGAVLRPAAGQTLTIVGAIDAAATQHIFDLSAGGSIVLPSAIDAAHVGWFGAKGDLATDDTAAIKATAAALTSGGTLRTLKNATGYKITDEVMLLSNTTVDGGGLIKQATDGKRHFVATSQDSITFKDVQLKGTGAASGETPTSNCQGIKLTSCTNVRITKGTFSRFKFHAIALLGCSDVFIDSVDITESTTGIILSGCQRVKIQSPRLRKRSADPSQFTAGIALDSTNGHVFGYCTDVSISDVNIDNWVNSQAILMHAGERVSISGGLMNDVLIGVSANPYGGVYATTAANFTQPAVNSTVSMQVDTTSLLLQGNTIYVPGGGIYTVASITDGTHAVITNTGHLRNAAPGATVNSGAHVGAGDSVMDLTVTGLTLVGTSTAGAGSPGQGNNLLFVVGGTDSPNPLNTTISGLTLRNSNAVNQRDGGGGAVFGYLTGLRVSSMVIDHSYGSGIVLSGNATLVDISGAVIRETKPSLGADQYGIYIAGTGCTGRISNVVIDGADGAIRSTVAAPSLFIDHIVATNVAARYYMPGATTDPVVDGLRRASTNPVDVSQGVRTVLWSGASDLTDMSGGYTGQLVTVLVASAGTKVTRAGTNGTNFALASSADMTATNDNAALDVVFSGAHWEERARSIVNG